MKKNLIYDKNKALSNYIKSRLKHLFIVEKYSRDKVEMMADSYLTCILIVYDEVDLFELIRITKYHKNVIIGTSSKEIIEHLKLENDDIAFFDFRDTKYDIGKRIESIIHLFEQ
jgi:hypothetical protein